MFSANLDTTILCGCGNAFRSGNTSASPNFAECWNCGEVLTRTDAQSYLESHFDRYESQLCFASVFSFEGFDRASANYKSDVGYLPQNILVIRTRRGCFQRDWNVATCSFCRTPLVWHEIEETWFHVVPTHKFKVCATDPIEVGTFRGFHMDWRLDFAPIGA